MPEQLRPAHPGRIIVKYRARMGACAHCLLARGESFADATGSRSLDQLNKELRVRGAQPLFSEQHGGTRSRAVAHVGDLDRARARFPARSARIHADAAAPDLSNVFLLDLPRGTDVAGAATRYAADADVEYAEPDYEVHATFVPDDPFFSSTGSFGQPFPDLWGLQVTQAATAWETARGDGMVIAVIDTGVDYNHPDLAANMWTNAGEIPGNGLDDDNNGFVDDVRGWDFVQSDNDPYDRHGHGTHVAGTAAAVGNNGTGVVGTAWGARVMPVRGLDANGSGYMSDLAQAIVYAANNGADVLNNSWGGPGAALVLKDAVNTATSLGAVVVAAAGNNGASVDYFEPADLPHVIAVGATDPWDEHLSFSNSGNLLSVSAPGSHILSLRGAVSGPMDSSGVVVAQKYLWASGTSMAAPHVAGLAAVLLSAMPTLTPDEVRWHLEVNADQPGYPGYEGQLWNPYFGWGRINGARVFDPPAVTTRMDTHSYQFQAIAGSVTPDVASLGLSFSTYDPVPWAVSGPSWFTPSPASGNGSGSLGFALDTTGLTAGSYSASVAVSVPAAIDGGGSAPVTLQVHRDERVGGEILIGTGFGSQVTDAQVVSDGLETLVMWSGTVQEPTFSPKLFSARIDSAGNVSGPATIIADYPHKENARLAFDGRNFLAVWLEDDEWLTRERESIKALRFSPTGEVLDGAPLTLDTIKVDRRRTHTLFGAEVAFDGNAYTVIWERVNERNNTTKVYLQRIGIDGSLRSPRRRIYPTGASGKRRMVYPRLACVTGSCLVGWVQYGGTTTADGRYVFNADGVLLAGDKFINNRPFRLIDDAFELIDIKTNGTGYMVLMARDRIGPGPVFLGRDAVAGRVTAAGVALDPTGIRLNNPPSHGEGDVWPTGLTFDGSNYVATFVGRYLPRGRQIFGVRVAPDGSVLDNEPDGLLLNAGGTAGFPIIVGASGAIGAARSHSVIAWRDNRFDGAETYKYSAIYAQRVLAHTSTPGFSQVEIGSIGPRAVAERSALRFTVAAPALNPATVTFNATKLPPGAAFDVPTGAFRWMPAANEAGVYSGAHFEASDGAQTLSEDVTITVAEANLSLSGTVTRSDGTPVPAVSIMLSGVPGVARTLICDAAGRFHFDDLAPGTYGLRLARPSTAQYTANTLSVSLGATDMKNVQFVVTPTGA